MRPCNFFSHTDMETDEVGNTGEEEKTAKGQGPISRCGERIQKARGHQGFQCHYFQRRKVRLKQMTELYNVQSQDRPTWKWCYKTSIGRKHIKV